MSNLRLKPQTILVVDDNEDDNESVRRAFTKLSMNKLLFFCKTGKEAMDFLQHGGSFTETDKAERPALILLDLNMPGIDGYRVLQLIKEDLHLRCIPVIIWTTSSNEKDIDACYRMGANAYMCKPVTPEALLESVKRFKEYWLETALLPSLF